MIYCALTSGFCFENMAFLGIGSSLFISTMMVFFSLGGVETELYG